MVLSPDRFFKKRNDYMSTINRDKLSKIIFEELQKALEEDALVSPVAKRKNAYRKAADTCEQCGYTMEAKVSTCEQCGYTMEANEDSKINESDCGCHNCDDCNDSSVVLYKSHNKKSHHGAYMSKKQLYKVAKYAQKLY